MEKANKNHYDLKNPDNILVLNDNSGNIKIIDPVFHEDPDDNKEDFDSIKYFIEMYLLSDAGSGSGSCPPPPTKKNKRPEELSILQQSPQGNEPKAPTTQFPAASFLNQEYNDTSYPSFGSAASAASAASDTSDTSAAKRTLFT